MEHSPGFLKVVAETRPRVKELTVEQARERLLQQPKAVLVDVREDREWDSGHATQALHLGRGVLERDLEKKFPDPDTELILYCGGGYRSVLAAASVSNWATATFTPSRAATKRCSPLTGPCAAIKSFHSRRS